jgi:hypothetical protein
MHKQIWLKTISFVLLLTLAACSSLQLPGTSANTAPAQNGQFDPANMPIESKLSMGTLKLEGTSQAVTAEQAKQLVLLWKAVKSLGNNNNTSNDEIKALYQQIQDSMTPEQMQAIQKMTFTSEDMRTMMQQYGIQGFGGNGGPNQTPDPSQRATRTAQRQNGGGQGGFPGGGGGFPGGGPGGFPGGGQGGNNQNRQGTPGVQRTPGAGGNRNFNRMNLLFIDPLIKLLEQRAGG